MEIFKGEVYRIGPYDWRVLDVQEDKALFIWDDLYEKRAYHDPKGSVGEFQYGSYTWEIFELNEQPAKEKAESVTWETCSLRKWLNGEFLRRFSEHDIEAMVETTLENKDDPHSNTKGGNSTKDKVFLLSLEEVEQYFSSDNNRVAYFDYDPANWWLRTPSSYHEGLLHAACVEDDGSFGDNCRLAISRLGVRPAVWLDYYTAYIYEHNIENPTIHFTV